MSRVRSGDRLEDRAGGRGGCGCVDSGAEALSAGGTARAAPLQNDAVVGVRKSGDRAWSEEHSRPVRRAMHGAHEATVRRYWSDDKVQSLTLYEYHFARTVD